VRKGSGIEPQCREGAVSLFLGRRQLRGGCLAAGRAGGVAGVRLAARFGVDRPRQAALALGLVTLFGLSAWQFPDRPWQQDTAQDDPPERATLELSQELFETQQAIWDKAVASLAPQRLALQPEHAGPKQTPRA
jgi:hypothetical protein